MKFTWFVCLVAQLELYDGIYCQEGRDNGRDRRSTSTNTTTVNNNTITALLEKALPVYCSTIENIHGVIPGKVPGQTPTAQPGLVSGQNPTAYPGLVSGQTPTAYPGLVSGQTPTAQQGMTPGFTTMMPKTTIPAGGGSGGAAMTTPAPSVLPSYNTVRVVALNDSQMHEVFQHKGGNYLHDYMAATKEEAEKNFPNLLLMTKPVKIAGTNSTLTAADNMLAQKTIIQDLQKLQVFLSTTAKPPSNVPVNATKGMATTANAVNSRSSQMPKSSVSSITTTPSIATSNATRSSAPTANISTNSNSSVATSAPSIAPSSNHNVVSGQSTSFPSSTMGKVITPSFTVSNQKQSPNSGNGPYSHGNKTIGPITPSNPPALGVSTASNKNTTKANLANLHHPGKVSQTASSANLVPTFTYKTPTPYPSPPTRSHPTFDSGSWWNSDSGFHDLDILWREANTTIHPESLMELVPSNRRNKRGADGSESEEQYCQLKGSKTQDGYLHMCSTCAVITKLPDHFFPRYINEAVCKTDDSNCFVINGIPHGECRQRTITLNIMKKKQNKCLLMVKNGENIMIDDWELYPKTIRVSCECLIKKNSFLAPYVKGSLPRG